MEAMTLMMDYMISSQPIRIVEQKFDKSKLKMKSLIVTEIGHLPGRISRRTRATFETWALAFIADGCGTYQVNRGPVQHVSKGGLFFVWPGAEFTYGPSETDTWEEYYINFEGKRIDELEQYRFIRRAGVEQVSGDQLWAHKIQTLMSLLASGVPANADRAAFGLESLLFEFSLMSDPEYSHNRNDKWYNILEDLSNHAYEAIDAESIASRHNIAVSTLRRVVRIHTGYPLNEYMHRLKMSEAKKLLANTTANVKDVARILQYEDVYYFSRLFRKFAGLPPKKFRDTI